MPVKKEKKNKSNLMNSCCFDENKQKNKTQRIGKNVRNNQGLLSADVIKKPSKKTDGLQKVYNY